MQASVGLNTRVQPTTKRSHATYSNRSIGQVSTEVIEKRESDREGGGIPPGGSSTPFSHRRRRRESDAAKVKWMHDNNRFVSQAVGTAAPRPKQASVPGLGFRV